MEEGFKEARTAGEVSLLHFPVPGDAIGQN
jgi:hypothetical protein